MRARSLESSMEFVLAQKHNLLCKYRVHGRVFMSFCINMPSMDSILMLAIVHGVRIDAKGLVVCADISLMDELFNNASLPSA